MTYEAFFARLTQANASGGFSPFPYQAELATRSWPDLLDVPTGLGKTLAVVGAWLWKRSQSDPDTPRRLVYCLPMRSLVDQTAGVARDCATRAAAVLGTAAVPVHVMRGGSIDESWLHEPQLSCILIGTQDQLLSRALNRGYGVSRFAWPRHFAWLNDDAMWVLDETQLIGVGVTTSAQLQGLRARLGTLNPTRTLWVSATLDEQDVATVDHPQPEDGWHAAQLSAEDEAHPVVRKRTRATKRLSQLDVTALEKESDKKEMLAVAKAALGAHRAGTRTLIICNRVTRAQALYETLLKLGRTRENLGLIHSRFMTADRQRANASLEREGDQIVVATQAIEAGVDVSSTTLITELAPWASIVQRVGRCNRAGEVTDAHVYWIDVNDGKKNAIVPYDPRELAFARARLQSLDDIGPSALRSAALPEALAAEEADQRVRRRLSRPTLRRRDLLELYETTSDLAGNDLDVSRFIRDGDDNDVEVAWLDFAGKPPSDLLDAGDVCRVSIGAAKKFVAALGKKSKSPTAPAAFVWDALDGEWRRVSDRELRPGLRIVCPNSAGGYDADRGWTGVVGKGSVTTSAALPTALPTDETALSDAAAVDYAGDPASHQRAAVSLTVHLADVERAAHAICDEVAGLASFRSEVATAARWHDVGKAHDVFQEMLYRASGAPRGPLFLAKGQGNTRAWPARRYFRHELASALAYWQSEAPSPTRDLVAFLIASHHGKVRGSLRALPDERAPAGAQSGALFARGVWHGDVLPEVVWAGGERCGPHTLSLEPMRMGGDSWMGAFERLVRAPERGPFRLAVLEAALRTADARASATPSATVELASTQEAS